MVLQEGEQILVADGGGLTVNVASYVLGRSSDAGATIDMAPSGHLGDTCGSETVTERCFEHVKAECNTRLSSPSQGGNLSQLEHPGGFAQLLTDLGWSETRFHVELSQRFEGFKARFREQKETTLVFGGISGRTKEKFERRFTITKYAGYHF